MMTALTGCSTSTGYAIGGSRNSPQTRPEDIIIVNHASASEYQVIGRVHAHSIAPQWLPFLLKSQDELREKLKKEAALLHAEVIINTVRYSRSQFEWQEEHLMGTAAIITHKKTGDAH